MPHILLSALIAIAALGGCTAIYPDGTQIRVLDSAYSMGYAPSYHLSGYAVAPVYNSDSYYRQPVYIPSIRFGPMIRNNVRLVYVDGEARECDVRPRHTGSCYSGPKNWGSAMMDRR